MFQCWTRWRRYSQKCFKNQCKRYVPTIILIAVVLRKSVL
jgi:hypothetical protein